MNSQKKWLPGLILHVLFWSMTAFIIISYAFGQASCDPIGDDVSGCASMPGRAVVGSVGLVIGFFAIIAERQNWKRTKYIFLSLAIGWLWFAVYLYRSTQDIITAIFIVPAIIYGVLAWSRPKL